MRTTRPDGALLEGLAPTRLLLPLLVERRNEAAVYFDQELDVTQTLRFLEAHNRESPHQPLGLFHVFLWAVATALHERPRLNRFVSGGRLYQRHGVYLSFAAKQRKLDDEAPLVTVKRRIPPGASLGEVAALVSSDIVKSRESGPRPQDRELMLAARLPHVLLRLGVRLMRWLDRHNLLPASAIENDPFHTSLFVANLGSLGMAAGYHHLYEWGNCPFFAVIGATRTVHTESGPRMVMTVRYTFDERIDDGLSCARSLELVRTRVENAASHAAEGRLSLVA